MTLRNEWSANRKLSTHGLWSARCCRLPQFDRISLRIMQASKAAVGIGLWVNLDVNSCRTELSYFVPDLREFDSVKTLPL